MRYPEFLKDGGRVGFIAPSFGCTGEYYGPLFERAVERFQEKGYRTVEGPNCRLSEGIGKSSTPEKCAAEINDFFMNDRCDVIISCGGGETMCEDLPFVDFEGMRKAKPHWYMGYSDNTNLTFTLPVLCDTAAIYGPCAPKFSMQPRHPAIADALSLLRGEKLTVKNYDTWEKAGLPEDADNFLPWNTTEEFLLQAFEGAEPVKKTRMSGRLLGGCLDCLSVLCGTKYDQVKEFNEKYKEDGVLWFLESCDLNPLSIRRVLWQLREAGWFSSAKGFLIGRPLHYEEELMGMDRINAVTGILGVLGVPIVMDLDIGHLPPQMPLISGAFAEADVLGNAIEVRMFLR